MERGKNTRGIREKTYSALRKGSATMTRTVRSPEDESYRSSTTGVPRIEAYEADDRTVIFDGVNPLAWVASSESVRIDRLA